jgi:hypothetical protein
VCHSIKKKRYIKEGYTLPVCTALTRALISIVRISTVKCLPIIDQVRLSPTGDPLGDSNLKWVSNRIHIASNRIHITQI